MDFISTIEQYISFESIPDIKFTDIIEIAILTFLIYQVLIWMKRSRAWVLLRGIIVMILFLAFAWIFQMNTILFLFKNVFSIGITALVIVFQPELRKALEQLGQTQILKNFNIFESSKKTESGYTDRTINELIRASFDMGKAKTGALICIERTTPLGEYERTGIAVDAVISSQLLINIFEHNTPLHDGAVLVRDGRIVSATCYLPLSDNLDLSKELGTRHRAAVGLSEVTDAITIVVSEETGAVSVARNGLITRNLDAMSLREILSELKEKPVDNHKFNFLKGWARDERKAVK